MIICSLKGPRCSRVLWGFLKTSSPHLKNSFWSPWKYRVHERSGGELWSGAGVAGSRTGEDTQGPIIFIMYSIRPSRQSAVFLEVRAPRLQIYSEPWLPSNKRGTKSNSPRIVSLLLSAFPSGVSLKITTGANTEKIYKITNSLVTEERRPRECSQGLTVQKVQWWWSADEMSHIKAVVCAGMYVCNF